MRIAKELSKPLIIHCRDAFPELKELLLEEGKGLKGVLHCFTGSPADLSSFEEFDLYVSFSGIVTFPNAKSVQAAATVARKERLLVETDCPFLAPQKVRGQKNEPAYVWLVAEKVAELRSTDLPEIAQTCSNNARTLFGLPEIN
jgi:TatD DNase family protein